MKPRSLRSSLYSLAGSSFRLKLSFKGMLMRSFSATSIREASSAATSWLPFEWILLTN